MELKAAQDTPRFWRWEGLVKRAGRVGRQIVEHDPDFLDLGEVQVDEIAQ